MGNGRGAQPTIAGPRVRLRPWRADDVDPENTGSRRVAERAGYRAEGVIRQRFLYRGRPSDFVLYARLASDPSPEPGAPTG